MGYVMVPVPEEFVTEIMQTVVRLGFRAQMEPWDEETLTRLFDDMDESAKALLGEVARGTLADGHVAEQDVATKLEIGVREIHGIMREIADWAQEAARLNPVMSMKQEHTMASGRVRERRVLHMERPIATWLRDIERADLIAAPHSLQDRGD